MTQLTGSETWSATQTVDLNSKKDTLTFKASLDAQYTGGSQQQPGKASNCTIHSQYSGEYDAVDTMKFITAPACQEFYRMLSESQGLIDLADKLEKDDQTYEDAVADMLLQGYDSGFAVLGLDVNDADISLYLHNEIISKEHRANIIAAIRKKAGMRRAIALAGITGDTGKTTINPRGIPITDNPGISQERIKYFCSPSTANLSSDSWAGLYEAGYIDYATYHQVAWNNFIDNLFIGSLETVISTAAIEILPVRLLGRYLLPIPEGSSFEIGAVQAERLLFISRSNLTSKPIVAVGRVYQGIPAATLNKLALEKFVAEGGDPSSWITEWLPGTVAEEIISTSPRRVYRVFAKGQSKNAGYWVSIESFQGLRAVDIKRRLALPFVPTHIVEIIIPSQTKMTMGWSAGSTNQIRLFIDLKDLEIVPGSERPLP